MKIVVRYISNYVVTVIQSLNGQYVMSVSIETNRVPNFLYYSHTMSLDSMFKKR